MNKSLPQCGPSAPPYPGSPQSQPGVHSFPLSARYHPASHTNGFDSVDLEAGPNSSCAPAASKPMMAAARQQHHHQQQQQHHQQHYPHNCSRLTSVSENNNMDHSPSTKTSKKRHVHRRWLVALGALSLTVVAALVVAFVVYSLVERRPPIPAVALHTNCVSCAVLERAMADSSGRMSVNVAELDIKRAEDGKLLCCLKVSDKTDAILEMLLEHARQTGVPVTKPQVQNRTDVSPTTAREVAARQHHRNQAAALVGIEKAISAINDRELYVLKEWGHESSSALYIRPEISYNPANGHFTVPRDGLYNINIHLSLANYGKEMKRFGQRLFRFNRHSPAKGDEKLAYDMENVPKDEQRTSSLALTVHLRKNDELFLQVSPASLVVDDSSMSFFCIVFESP